MKAITV